MLMTVSKFLYALTALVFAGMIIYGKLFVFKKENLNSFLTTVPLWLGF